MPITGGGGGIISYVASSWTPASLGGSLLAWYKADNGSVLHGAVPATDGQSVDTWNDISGNGRHLTSGGATQILYQATGFNGKPTVKVTEGNGQVLNAASFPMGSGSAGSCWWAGKITTAATLRRIIVYAGPGHVGTDTDSYMFSLSGSAATDFASFQIGTGIVATKSFTTGNNYRFASIVGSGTGQVYIDNVAGTSGSVSFSFVTNGTLSIGAENTGGSDCDVSVSEMFITNTDETLNGTVMTDADNYLKTGWGL